MPPDCLSRSLVRPAVTRPPPGPTSDHDSDVPGTSIEHRDVTDSLCATVARAGSRPARPRLNSESLACLAPQPDAALVPGTVPVTGSLSLVTAATPSLRLRVSATRAQSSSRPSAQAGFNRPNRIYLSESVGMSPYDAAVAEPIRQSCQAVAKCITATIEDWSRSFPPEIAVITPLAHSLQLRPVVSGEDPNELERMNMYPAPAITAKYPSCPTSPRS